MRMLALPVLVAATLLACTLERAPLVAGDLAVSRPMPGSRVSAGYLTLSNNTTQTITITRVTSPQFESVAMHESALEDGMVRMYPLGALTILPKTTVTFERGGKHLMLINPIGNPDSTTLEFYAGKALVLSVNVAFDD